MRMRCMAGPNRGESVSIHTKKLDDFASGATTTPSQVSRLTQSVCRLR